jgi:aminoglycoside N3'-acetyltransferase
MSSSWGSEDFRRLIKSFDLNKYENVFVHSNLSYLGKPKDGVASEIILDQLEDNVLDESNLLLPAFTYSFGRNKVFDPMSADNLPEMGALSLLAFERRYSRSIDPMFSMLGSGKSVQSLLSLSEANSFGKNSTFGKLASSNTALLLVCVGGGSTLVHEIERNLGITYRFDKEFQGEIVVNNCELAPLNWKAYVRDYEFEVDSTPAFENLTSFLLNSKTLKIERLGMGYVGIIDVELLKKDVKDLVSINPYALIKG